MAVKSFEVPAVGTVHVYKRRGVKNIRLSVDHQGRVRVSMPTWAPYKAALAFVAQRQDWIADQKDVRPVRHLHSGLRIGKYHTLYLERDVAAERVRTRLARGGAFVYYPSGSQPTDDDVQQAAQTVGQKALRQQAEQVLPQRLRCLAAEHGFSFRSVSARNLKARWGSCDAHTHITLNYFLMQLQWELIDYVLIHELVHTRYLNHSSAFWQEVERILPDYRLRRKALKNHQPAINAFESIKSMA